jgi:hypothetical protein
MVLYVSHYRNGGGGYERISLGNFVWAFVWIGCNGGRVGGRAVNIGVIYLKKSQGVILKGVVIEVYEKFFLVDFGKYRECFSNIRDKEEKL